MNSIMLASMNHFSLFSLPSKDSPTRLEPGQSPAAAADEAATPQGDDGEPDPQPDPPPQEQAGHP